MEVKERVHIRIEWIFSEGAEAIYFAIFLNLLINICIGLCTVPATRVRAPVMQD
jgi:hypothetical protein